MNEAIWQLALQLVAEDLQHLQDAGACRDDAIRAIVFAAAGVLRAESDTDELLWLGEKVANMAVPPPTHNVSEALQ